MDTTTIEIREDLRDKLRAERKPHESNYSQTIARLLDAETGGQLWTEQEIRDLCRAEVRDELEARRR